MKKFKFYFSIIPAIGLMIGYNFEDNTNNDLHILVLCFAITISRQIKPESPYSSNKFKD